MPLYDFKCLDCGIHFEALVLKEPAACPQCQSKKLEQMLSMFGVSSESTRASNMKGQQAKNAKVRKEYQVAQAEYEREHRH